MLGGVEITWSDNGCTVAGFDYESAIRVNITARCSGAGRAIVNHAQLLKLIKAFGKKTTSTEISLTTSGHVTVSADGMTIPVEVFNLDDYPGLPEKSRVVTSARVDRALWSEVIRRAASVASNDDTLPVLTGIHLVGSGAGVRVEATDRFVLMRATLPADIRHTEFGALISAQTLGKVTRYFDGEIVTIEQCQAGLWRFVSGSVELFTRTLDSEFPRTDHLVSTSFACTATADRATLDALVKRVHKISTITKFDKDDASRVIVRPGRDCLEVLPVVPQEHAALVHVDPCPAEVSGDADATTISGDRLTTALSLFSSSAVAVQIQEPNGGRARPVVFAESDDAALPPDFQVLVMPMRTGDSDGSSGR
ncbi:hypothetical protein MOQ72_37150 [Saccharopolyspora sp. K220]|nr:hypothetical protein [Saccharopolyspora soli]